MLAVLARGEVEVEGRMPWASNGTFLVTCAYEGSVVPAIYKPGRGERALWDFPGGLFRREAAAYHLSVALGWDLVPETLVRRDAPLGPGSLQRFVPAHFSEHYFTLLDEPAHHDGLRQICAFDLLANNADRKGGHCLLGEDGSLWAIDNGLCFHPEPKLRTVIWDFAGEPVPRALAADVARLAEALSGARGATRAGTKRVAGGAGAGGAGAGGAGAGGALDDALPEVALDALLAPDEMEALRRRAAALVGRPRFPAPHPDRRPYPWPLV